MGLLSTSNHKLSGFTIIEILVVLGISMVIGSMGIGLTTATLRKHFFDIDMQTITNTILTARARSLTGQGSITGVHIENKKIILFSGARYNQNSPKNEVSTIGIWTVNGQVYDLTFEPGTAYVKSPATIQLTDGVTVASLTVNSIGTINP